MSPFTRGDSLRLFLTGAGADGGAQAEPEASLGGYRSSSQAGGLGFLLSSALRGVTINFIAAANGIGMGTLQAADPNSLSWAAPGGGRAGTPVSIANGQTVLLESAGNPNQFVVVTRTAAAGLLGACSVSTVESFNDLFGMGNAALPAGGAAITYRCVCLKNGSSQTLTNLLIWLGAATNPIAIGLQAPSSQPAGTFGTIANENTAPAGVTFVSPSGPTDPNVLSVAHLNPNEQTAVWIRRDLTSASAAAIARTGLQWSVTASG